MARESTVFLLTVVARQPPVNRPAFADMRALRRYIDSHGVSYLDLGASKGGSRAMLETMMRSAGEARPRVLGLDIDDRKLRMCNAGAVEPKCGFMDLSRLEPEPKPLVKGVVAIDVFEHINEPVSPASGNEAVWPTRSLQMQRWQARCTKGHWFDVSSVEVASKLFVTVTAAVSQFVYLAGPSFDHVDWLRNSGLTRYYERWSGHITFFNSTVVVAASPRTASVVVVLLGPIYDSDDARILAHRDEPCILCDTCDDRDCPASNRSAMPRHMPMSSNFLGCDLREADLLRGAAPGQSQLALKPTPPIAFIDPPIHRSMRVLLFFDDLLSRETAAIVRGMARTLTKYGGTVVHCARWRRTVTTETATNPLDCFRLLAKEARAVRDQVV